MRKFLSSTQIGSVAGPGITAAAVGRVVILRRCSLTTTNSRGDDAGTTTAGAATATPSPTTTATGTAKASSTTTNTSRTNNDVATMTSSNSSSSPAASVSPVSTSTSSSSASPPNAVANERMQAIFANRRNPTNLYREGMRSGTLSDHPVTHKVARDELEYRQRKLVERGNYEGAADAEMEVATRDREGRAGAETNEYRWVLFFVTLGYITAHLVVYKIYYPEDMRLPYDPERGYVDQIERRQKGLEGTDELVGGRVLALVFDERKAAVKAKAAGLMAI